MVTHFIVNYSLQAAICCSKMEKNDRQMAKKKKKLKLSKLLNEISY